MKSFQKWVFLWQSENVVDTTDKIALEDFWITTIINLQPSTFIIRKQTWQLSEVEKLVRGKA